MNTSQTHQIFSIIHLSIVGPSRRVKREEKVLDSGCMCHRTTVASAALVQYVRYLSEALAARRV